MADRLTTADVACWVLKTRTAPPLMVPGWAPGSARSLTRCVRLSYRVDLMQAGQPCLLWLSGRAAPGVQAIGRLSGPATVPDEADPSRPEAAVPVTFTLLTEPVDRAALLADHVFAAAEVLRMPAGSNPSYLSPPVLDALLDHVNPGDRRRAGW
jgi:hypothetical protein